MTFRKSVPHKTSEILYEIHHGDAQVFSIRAWHPRGARWKFQRSHPDTDIHEILVMGRHGRWVPVSPDALEVAV